MSNSSCPDKIRPANSISLGNGRLAILLLFAALFPLPSFAQSKKAKVPVLNKLGGTQHMAFSGVVRSLDMKMKILNVERAEAKDVEIFRVNRSTHVVDANGRRLDLSALRPGIDVVIYYNEKAGERKITQIMALESGSVGAKKTSHSKS